MKILRTTSQLRANAWLFASHAAKLRADSPVSQARCLDPSARPVLDLANSGDLQSTLLSPKLLRNR